MYIRGGDKVLSQMFYVKNHSFWMITWQCKYSSQDLTSMLTSFQSALVHINTHNMMLSLSCFLLLLMLKRWCAVAGYPHRESFTLRQNCSILVSIDECIYFLGSIMFRKCLWLTANENSYGFLSKRSFFLKLFYKDQISCVQN